MSTESLHSNKNYKQGLEMQIANVADLLQGVLT